MRNSSLNFHTDQFKFVFWRSRKRDFQNRYRRQQKPENVTTFAADIQNRNSDFARRVGAAVSQNGVRVKTKIRFQTLLRMEIGIKD